MAISRGELPEEFFDITSAKLLVQPEPQYVYAQMFLAAVGASLNVPGALGRAGVEISGQGAPYTSAEADRFMLASAIPQSVFAAKVDFKGQPGHTMRFNRPQFTDSTYTQAAREIGANQTISVVPITVDSEQVSLTVKRFGGPYDNTNSRVAPYALDNFDASMGIHSLTDVVGTHMKRDLHRTLDSFYVTLFDLAATTVYPEGMTADNDATAKGMFPMTYEQMSRTAKGMDESNLPTLPDGRRILVCTPTGKKQLKDDPQYARYSEFHKEINPLFPGYFGSTPEFHLFQSNTLSKPTNSSTVAIHRAHAIAPGLGLAGVGKMPRVAAASDDNYGETAKLIWLGYFAPGIADNRFCVSMRYAEDV